MSIIKRITSMFKAKLNNAVGKAERADPIGIANNELREAKEDLAKLETGVKQAKGAIKIAEGKMAEAEKSADSWKEKAKIAKDAGNLEVAQKAAEKSIEFTEEAIRRKTALAASENKFENVFERFKNKTKEIDALGSKIKEAEVSLKTAKALNDLETSETSGAGVKSVDRINDMLDIANEEVAMSEASLEIGTSDEVKLESEIAKMGAGKKANDLLDTL